jgi:cell division septal protein FtsQ
MKRTSGRRMTRSGWVYRWFGASRRAPRPSRRRRVRWPVVPMVIGAAVVTGLIVSVGLVWVRGLGAWQPHWTAPWPVIRTVHLRGVSRLSPEEVRVVLPLHVGERLSTGRMQAAANRLSAHPWIAAATLSWVMPDTLVVNVQERQPAAVVREGGVPWYVDRQGVLLGPAGAKPGPIGEELNGVSVTRLRAGSSEEQRRVRDGVALLELMRGDGVQTAQVTVESDGAAVASFDGWRLRFRTGRIEEQWRRFWQVAARIPSDPRHPKEVDLRFTNSVVVRS